MLNVFFTVDTETWPETPDWRESNMTADVARDYYGHTPKGDFGALYQADLLYKHGLKGVFFVETLFTDVVGVDHLRRIVGELLARGHEVGLHLHPEWMKRIPAWSGKRATHMSQLPEEQQSTLIAQGIERLRECGVDRVYSFRAGNYGANRATLRALARNGVIFDSSYNFCYPLGDWELPAGTVLLQPVEMDGVWEFPVSYIEDYPGHYRHAQLVACSSRELRTALQNAEARNWHSFVIVSHGFELINRYDIRGRLHPSRNGTMLRRFDDLCRFLSDHRDRFHTATFRDSDPVEIRLGEVGGPLKGALHHTVARMAEQLYKKIC